MVKRPFGELVFTADISNYKLEKNVSICDVNIELLNSWGKIIEEQCLVIGLIGYNELPLNFFKSWVHVIE